MLHNAILLKNLIENSEWPSSIDHEILRDDFEPVNYRLARKDVRIVGNTQADADTVVLKRVESIA